MADTIVSRNLGQEPYLLKQQMRQNQKEEKDPRKMKKNTNQNTSAALMTIDAYFMEHWRSWNTGATGFTRSGEECRKLRRNHGILALMTAFLSMIWALLSPFILYANIFGLVGKIGFGLLLIPIAIIGVAAWKRHPGKTVLKAAGDWVFEKHTAKKLGVLQAIAEILDPNVQYQYPVDTRNLTICLERLLKKQAAEMHFHERDGAAGRKKRAKKHFYTVYDFVQNHLGVKLKGAGEYLREETSSVRILA